MNRVVIQEGYALPFAGMRKRRGARRRSGSRAFKTQQSKMKACAKKWNGKGSYRAFMKRCLKSR